MKKRYLVIIGIVLILVGVRIYLPYGVIKYVNKTLAEIPGYTGSIDDVDIQLYKGAYSIDRLKILKEDSAVYIPFFSSKRIDLSVQWKALFNGAIVGEVELIEPVLNFVSAKDSTESQYGEEVDWTEPIRNLIPLQINKFRVVDGNIFFKSPDSKPEVDIYLKNFDLTATNLNNAKSIKSELPSHVSASATSIGDGKLTVEGDLNILKKTPNMDIDLKFEEVDLTALNDFLRVYANLDVEKGVFNLYSEVIIDESRLTGYVKPLMTDLKILKWKGDNDNPLQLIWESVAAVIVELFENQKKDQFAIRTPFEGDVSDPDVKILPTIWSVFSNAFVEAFKKNIDNSIEFSEEKESRLK